MGGYGSGNYRGSRYTVDSAFNVPIGWMIRQCPIREGTWRHTMSWRRNGEEIGSIGYILARDFEKPKHLIVTCSLNGQPFEQILELVHKRMPKGGLKTYVVCPYCRTNRLTLFFSSLSQLCCRNCANFTYESCQENRKHSGLLKYLYAELEEEARWDRKVQSIWRRRERCKEWRKRKSEPS